MLKTLIAVAVLAASSGTAAAGDWLYATHSDNVAVGIDISTLRTSGTRKIGWTIWVNPTTQAVGGPSFDYRLSRSAFDCDAQTIQHLSSTYYLFADSRPIDQAQSDPIQHVVPDTLAAGLMELACLDWNGNAGPDITVSAFAAKMRAEIYD